MRSKNILLGCACLFAVVVAPALVAAPAAPFATASVAPSVAPPNRPISYHGRISALDANAKTLTIATKRSSRVLKVTDQTRIVKDDAPATLNDLPKGAMVRGSYWKKSDGSLEARSIKLGGKRAKAAANPATAASPAPSPTATP